MKSGISDRVGLTHVPEQLMRVVVAFYNINYHYGYMKLKKWGFWFNDCVFYSFWDYKSSADINL